MAIAIIAAILVACLISAVAPWVGVLCYYALALGQPQGLWQEEFADSRFTLYVTAATAIGICVSTAARRVDYRVLYQPQNVLMAIMVLWVNLSAHYSTFTKLADPISEISSGFVLEYFNKIALFYFLAVLAINTREKLLYCLYMFAGVGILYTLWANKVYVTGEFWRFGDNGRLNGPFGMYFDENYLAIIYVLVTPVLYYLGYAARNQFLRFAFWIPIVFAWHAIFLTGSRGALVALIAVCCYIAVRSYNKIIAIGFLTALALAIGLQGGSLVSRVSETVEMQRDQFREYKEDALDPRIISWKVGMQMIKEHPYFGVGVANFQNAYSSFNKTKPHVAHNTFLEYAANCGLITGLIFLSFFGNRALLFWRTRKLKKANGTFNDWESNYIDDTINASLFGFFVIALFLDLMIYEYMYFFLVLGFCKHIIDHPLRRQTEEPDLSHSIYHTQPEPERSLVNQTTNRH